MGAKQSTAPQLKLCRPPPSTHRPSLVEIDVEIISTKISHDQKLLLILEEGGQAIVVCLKDGKEIPFGHAAAQEHIVTGDWHCDSKTLLLASRTGNLSIFRYSPKQHHFVFVHQFPIKSETDRHWIGSLNASLRVTFNHHGTSITTCYYANDRTCFLLLVLFDGQTLSHPTRIPFNHFHFGKVTCMATLDHRLTIVGTSTGKVLFKMKNQDKEEDFRSLRSLYHRIGEDAYDKRKKGDTPRELRDSGFSCIELREAGYKADELHALCALPPSTKNGDCDFTHLSDAQIICENKYGRITFVHPKDPADIRVVYQDGSTNTINTHDQCLATDYLERGSVRLLQWSSGGGSGKSSSGSSGGSNSSSNNNSNSSNNNSNNSNNSNSNSSNATANVAAFKPKAGVAFITQSHDGTLILVGSTHGSAFIVVTKTRRIWHMLGSLNDDERDHRGGDENELLCGSFTNTSNNYCCTGSRNGSTRVYDVFEGDLLFVVAKTFGGPASLISSLQYNPTDEYLIQSSWGDNTVQLLSAKDGSIVFTNQFESEIVDVYLGNDVTNDALIVITQEGELHFVHSYDLPLAPRQLYNARIHDVHRSFLLGMHKVLGKHSPVIKLAGCEGVLRIIITFLFHAKEDKENVVFRRILSNTLLFDRDT